jgi:hypothetical protein
VQELADAGQDNCIEETPVQEARLVFSDIYLIFGTGANLADEVHFEPPSKFESFPNKNQRTTEVLR